MRISEQARQRVLRAAQELDYRPNLLARGLRTDVTHTVALVSDTIATEHYAGRIFYGGLAAALARQHLLFVGETEGDPAVEARLIENFLDRRVDGFVYASMFTREVRLPRGLRGQPVVLLNCFTGDGALPAVVPDEVSAGRTAARVLLEAGHRDGIWLVGENVQRTVAGRERLAGIEAMTGTAGCTLAGVLECPWWPAPALEALTAFLRGGARPSALICLNDRIAFGAYQALADVGLDVPRDVSVVSFDDSDLAAWVRPQLTSVALPHYDLGRRAVERLLDRADPGGVERLPMPLRSRASVGPPGA